MDILKLLIISLLFTSRAKLSYLSEQGIGQAKLLFNARDNEEILADKNVKEEHKEKIRQIEIYKKYFYEYWKKESTDLYSETTLLDRDAVTYLVIASKPNEIKAHKECFPFYGCFPYLGYFKKNSAKKYVKRMQEKGYETYMRRVLAYSTLRTFDDPIISTFFQYSKYELAETIFHELFHTIYFVDDEVDLNENLANYFGKAMVFEYFGENEEVKKYFEREKKSKELMSVIVEQAKKLEKGLEGQNWAKFKSNFISQQFPDEISKACKKLNLSSCWPLKLKWNSATFAAFMTYEKNQNKIELLAAKFNHDLRKLFAHIEKKQREYNDLNPKESFEDYILK